MKQGEEKQPGRNGANVNVARKQLQQGLETKYVLFLSFSLQRQEAQVLATSALM